jgi:hypothetical protein
VVTPAPTPPALARLSLEVSPAAARVSIDGTAVEVRAGRVLIEGPVGSVRTARVTAGGRTMEQRVAITEDGLFPARVVLASSSQPAHLRAPLPKSEPLNASGAVPDVSPGPASSSAIGLTTTFE